MENHTKHNRADQVLTQEGTFGFITDSENSKRPTGVVTGGLAVDQYLLNHPLWPLEKKMSKVKNSKMDVVFKSLPDGRID